MLAAALAALSNDVLSAARSKAASLHCGRALDAIAATLLPLAAPEPAHPDTS